MRNASIVLTILMLTGCSASSANPANSEPEIRAANEAYNRALVEGDAIALNLLLTDDFRIIDDDAGIHGKRDQIEFMTTEVDLIHARGDDVEVTMLGPDAALVTGRFIGRYRYQGTEREFTERYTSIWVRDRERWRVMHEHASIQPAEEGKES
jgi:ketosteroid isomerase-like protein